MRVISGTAKGQNLKMPRSKYIRPTGDRVKEALFNILGETVIDCFFLDCFAGSGAIGIEALSRGAKETHFIEKDRKAVSIIRENLEKTGLYEKTKIWSGDFYRVVKSNLERDFYDIIFLDPPYQYKPLPILEPLLKTDCLKNKGYLILETKKKTSIDRFGYDFKGERGYGDSKLMFWQKDTGNMVR